MRYKPQCFGLLLLLLSTVLCACTVMISLVVVITQDFESQVKFNHVWLSRKSD